MRLRKIFSVGNQATGAFNVSGTMHISFEEEGKNYVIETENSIVGALEHLLAAKPYAPSKRLYSCFVEAGSTIKEISMQSVDEKFRDFDEGIDSNVYLARLLSAANDFYVLKQMLLPKEISEYQLRAKAYFKFVDALRKINISVGNEDLRIFLDQCKETSIFKDGLLWGRSDGMERIDLPPEPLKQFIKAYEPGSVICKEGDTDSEMYVLLQGTVSVQVASQFVAQLSLPGEAIGELSLFLDDRRSATLIADERVLLYVIPQEELLNFHETHPDVFLIIARTTADRIFRVLERVRRFQFAAIGSDDEERLAGLKRELATKGRRELKNLHKEFKSICDRAGDERLNRLLNRMEASP